MKFIGCDAHKRYSVFMAVDENGRYDREVRVGHEDREAYRRHLQSLPPGSPIALETLGNCYWMVDEIERAVHVPLLTHAGKAKLMMGNIHKSDKLDVRGLTVLLRNGTLPRVWIPPAKLRDERELLRSRMFWVGTQTRFKNRVQATLSKYGLRVEGYSDLFGQQARPLLERCLGRLPPETRRCCSRELYLLDQPAVADSATGRADQCQDCHQAGHSAGDERAGDRPHPGFGDRVRGGQRGPLSRTRATGQLCRHGATGAFQRRQMAAYRQSTWLR